MKDQGLINEPLALANSETALPEPHFDDIAVAIAQPVEPLAPPARRMRRTSSVSTAVLIRVLVAIVGLSTMTFGLTQVYRQINSPEPVVTGPEEAAITAAPETANIQTERDVPSRPPVRRQRRVIVIVPEGRPVARKVGEVVYRNE